MKMMMKEHNQEINGSSSETKIWQNQDVEVTEIIEAMIKEKEDTNTYLIQSYANTYTELLEEAEET